MCNCMNGMKKRKSIKGLGNIGATLTEDVLPAAVGYVVGDILTKQLTFLANNAMMGSLVKIAAGALLSGQGGFMKGAGVGLAANGVAGVVLPALKSGGIALLPPGDPARSIAGIPMPQSGGNPVVVTY